MTMDQLSMDVAARIAWMAGAGCTAEEIAADTRIRMDSARVRFVVDRLDLPPLTSSQDPVPLRLTVPRALVAVLDRAAVARKIGRADMAETIVKAVLADNLVAAVIDDGAGS